MAYSMCRLKKNIYTHMKVVIQRVSKASVKVHDTISSSIQNGLLILLGITNDDEPLFAFWYDIQGGEFDRHILSFNHLPWYSAEKNHNPPPVGAISVGMKVLIVDLDQDGDNDVVSPGKTGLHVFYNQGTAPRAGQPSRLLLEKAFPSWIEWTNQ